MKNKLGRWVEFNQIYKSYNIRLKKEWHIEDVELQKGVFCGYRNIKEGEFGIDCNIVTKSIKVALVATNLKTLLYVPIENLVFVTY